MPRRRQSEITRLTESGAAHLLGRNSRADTRWSKRWRWLAVCRSPRDKRIRGVGPGRPDLIQRRESARRAQTQRSSVSEQAGIGLSVMKPKGSPSTSSQLSGPMKREAHGKEEGKSERGALQPCTESGRNDKPGGTLIASLGTSQRLAGIQKESRDDKPRDEGNPRPRETSRHSRAPSRAACFTWNTL